jgi:hypothetical protein
VPSRSISPRLRAPRGEFTPSYVTRKRLTNGELATAAGIGVGVALAVFYVAKVWLERTPVLPPASAGGALDRSTTPRRAAT